jgi:uncharacterized protein YutE (UPF0331/DUF86 family)
MVDRNSVNRKLLALNESLQELSRSEAGDPSHLTKDAVMRAAVERWMQIAIEACTDIATHVIADEGWTPPASARDSFLILAGHGRLPLDLAQRLGSAVGMRNVLVHDYARIDLLRLAAAVRNDLGDLREFAIQVAEWLRG